MLQKLWQFTQILRYMNQSWYIGEDMNGKELGKFLTAEDGRKREYVQMS